MISSKAYLTRFALFALLLILPFVAHGLLVDPYGIWGTRLIPENGYERFGRIKTKGDRVVKGIQLARGDNDIILLGNSRAQYGLDPASPVFGSARVYNGAIAGGRYYEVAAAMRLAAEHQSHLKRFIIGFDIASFFKLDEVGDYALSMLAGESRVTGYLSTTFSGAAVDESLRFWGNVRRNQPWTVNMNGLDRGSEMFKGEVRPKFIEVTGDSTTPCGANRTLEGQLRQRMQEFERTLVLMRLRGIAVDLLLPPLHVWPHAFEEMAEKTSMHELFKRLSVEMVERVMAQPGNGVVRLFDFNDLAPLAQDRVPPIGTLEQARYFYEASHYRPEVGSAMLAFALNGEQRFPDFGSELTRSNLEPQIEVTRARLKGWMDKHPDDLALLRERTDAKIRCSRMEANKMKAGH